MREGGEQGKGSVSINKHVSLCAGFLVLSLSLPLLSSPSSLSLLTLYPPIHVEEVDIHYT